MSEPEKQLSPVLVIHRRRNNKDIRSPYAVVKGLRQKVDDSHQAFDPEERDLRLARRSQYYWNKLTEILPAKTLFAPSEEMITSRPTLQRPATQDYIETTCIKGLLSSASDSRHLEPFAGTDRGLKLKCTLRCLKETILDHGDEAGDDNGSSLAGITSDEAQKPSPTSHGSAQNQEAQGEYYIRKSAGTKTFETSTKSWPTTLCNMLGLPRMSRRPSNTGVDYDGITCPKSRPKVAPIMLVSTGDVYIGSHMGGNVKLGGDQITELHMPYPYDQ
ncbi:hypothetical protein BGZ47_008523 [Haplosporangium gracile]|nr:hypothetical protein BGZ47_008523 [Haplosporangium gracile]